MTRLTPFGREIRRLRLEHEHTPRLKEMADALQVSSSYLSAIETGKKPASTEFVDAVAKLFSVDDSKRAELQRLAAASRKVVQLSLTGTNDKSRELAVVFARRFQDLSEDSVEKMLELIQHEQEKRK